MNPPGRISLPGSLFRSVETPARYLGGEINSIRKRYASRSICLLFPDIYDVGISYHGFQILYHILNSLEDVSCERSYLPWPDMQEAMKARRTPLFTVESRRPLREFDVIGITLQTEYHYPGVVKALDLSGIPRRAKERSEADPLIVGGGPCAFHPEPVAEFFDAFLLGDGEESAPELMELLRRFPVRVTPRRILRERLAELKGCYVPSLYGAEGARRVVPIGGVPKIVRARTVTELKPDFYPTRPLVPLVRGTHDRLVVEIMRGCTQGCRFCQAGMIHRPVRERSPGEISDQVIAGLDATGFDEVGLLSLSTSDYRGIESLVLTLSERLAGRRATLAFPSIRPATFSEELAGARIGGRRTTITFAIEAGSERLRKAISKHIDEEELFTAVERAYRFGWKTVKLYLMTGLPTETEGDLEDTGRLLRELQRLIPRGRRLNAAVSPFIPKPHTPFERASFLDPEDHERRRAILARALKSPRTALDWQGSDEALVEAALARGDRRYAKAIEMVADAGEGLESWGGLFSLARWVRAFDETVPDWRLGLKERSWDAPTPWDHLSKGVSRSFRRKEWEAARRNEPIADCREGACPQCGLAAICRTREQGDGTPEIMDSPSVAARRSREEPKSFNELPLYRFTFAKLGRTRMLGHHDLMRSVTLALRRAGAPLAYHRGFQPRAVVSYGPALPLGRGAVRLWMDFRAGEEFDAGALMASIEATLPAGIIPLGLERATKRERRRSIYRFRFSRPLHREAGDIAGAIVGRAEHAKWSLERGERTISIDWDEADGTPPGDKRIEINLADRGFSGVELISSTWIPGAAQPVSDF